MKRRRNQINLKDLIENGSEAFRRLNEATLEDRTAGVQDTKPQRNRRAALVEGPCNQKGMVQVPHSLFVRVVRRIPNRRHEQDDDNTNGGAKQLRDAIAELLGREGDSEADGFAGWEIVTEKGPFSLSVEIFEVIKEERCTRG